MCYHNDAIQGHCTYCKNEILEIETVVKDKDDLYHIECYNQMNLYMDEFGDIIKYNEDVLDIDSQS